MNEFQNTKGYKAQPLPIIDAFIKCLRKRTHDYSYSK